MSKKNQQAKHRSYNNRKIHNFDIRQRFLIVCEGTKTEPYYFEAFKTSQVVVRVFSTGKDPLTLVQKAKQEDSKSGGRYHQIWCVFDRDEFEPERIRQAIQQMEAEGYCVAFSNQSFELWYVLHFELLCTAISRDDYIQKLERLLNRTYTKNDPDMYKKLQERQEQAIENAQRLFEQYSPWDPVSCDPSTTVHLLVEELNKHRRP